MKSESIDRIRELLSHKVTQTDKIVNEFKEIVDCLPPDVQNSNYKDSEQTYLQILEGWTGCRDEALEDLKVFNQLVSNTSS